MTTRNLNLLRPEASRTTLSRQIPIMRSIGGGKSCKAKEENREEQKKDKEKGASRKSFKEVKDLLFVLILLELGDLI